MTCSAEIFTWGKPVLMLVTGRELLPAAEQPAGAEAWINGLVSCIAEAVRGGVTAVQIREQGLEPAELSRLTVAVVQAIRGSAGVFVNGAMNVAHRAGADGAHLPEAYSKPMTGCEGLLIGRSVHSMESAKQAERVGADYVVAGSIFETRSHPGAEPRGLLFLEDVCRAVSIPVIAIGGITAANTQSCMEAGASGIAVRSPILTSRHPDQVAGDYRRALHSSGYNNGTEDRGRTETGGRRRTEDQPVAAG